MHKKLSRVCAVVILGITLISLPTFSYALSLPEKTPMTPEEFHETLQKGTEETYKRAYEAIPTSQPVAVPTNSPNTTSHTGLVDPFEKQRNDFKETVPVGDSGDSNMMNIVYAFVALLGLLLLGIYLISQRNKSTNKTTMNKNQRHILAGLVPLIILIAAMGLATEQGNCFSKGCIDAFEWGSTWFIWVIAIGLITIFEYRIFKDRQ